MKIEADAKIAFPRTLVFSTYRDKLAELVPHLPNVRSIQVKESEETPGGQAGVTRKLNLWRAEGDVPKVAQAVIKPEMLAWDDHALWNQNDWTCEWRVEPHFFKENIRCRGKNQFIEQGDSTVLQIRGQLDIDLKGVKGVPSFLAGTVAPVIEKFIVALLTPNLTSVSKGLEAYLKQQKSA